MVDLLGYADESNHLDAHQAEQQIGSSSKQIYFGYISQWFEDDQTVTVINPNNRSPPSAAFPNGIAQLSPRMPLGTIAAAPNVPGGPPIQIRYAPFGGASITNETGGEQVVVVLNNPGIGSGFTAFMMHWNNALPGPIPIENVRLKSGEFVMVLASGITWHLDQSGNMHTILPQVASAGGNLLTMANGGISLNTGAVNSAPPVPTAGDIQINAHRDDDISAARDINLTAGRNLNEIATGAIGLTAASIGMTTTGNIGMTVGGDLDITARDVNIACVISTSLTDTGDNAGNIEILASATANNSTGETDAANIVIETEAINSSTGVQATIGNIALETTSTNSSTGTQSDVGNIAGTITSTQSGSGASQTNVANFLMNITETNSGNSSNVANAANITLATVGTNSGSTDAMDNSCDVVINAAVHNSGSADESNASGNIDLSAIATNATGGTQTDCGNVAITAECTGDMTGTQTNCGNINLTTDLAGNSDPNSGNIIIESAASINETAVTTWSITSNGNASITSTAGNITATTPNSITIRSTNGVIELTAHTNIGIEAANALYAGTQLPPVAPNANTILISNVPATSTPNADNVIILAEFDLIIGGIHSVTVTTPVINNTATDTITSTATNTITETAPTINQTAVNGTNTGAINQTTNVMITNVSNSILQSAPSITFQDTNTPHVHDILITNANGVVIGSIGLTQVAQVLLTEAFLTAFNAHKHTGVTTGGGTTGVPSVILATGAPLTTVATLAN